MVANIGNAPITILTVYVHEHGMNVLANISKNISALIFPFWPKASSTIIGISISLLPTRQKSQKETPQIPSLPFCKFPLILIYFHL